MFIKRFVIASPIPFFLFLILFPMSCIHPRDEDILTPTFPGGLAKAPHISVSLKPIAGDFKEPTEFRFHPGQDRYLHVLEKGGTYHIVDLKENKRHTLLQLKVPTESEEGLLGIAFHPDFIKNGYFYLNYTFYRGSSKFSRVSRWKLNHPTNPMEAEAKEDLTILEVKQPYANHNAGHLEFGPDGYLYIGWGDGGAGGDPHRNGQNTGTMLGTMLRIDVNHSTAGKPYEIPSDNPFVGRKDHLPEIFAYGLRNPWKYTFDPKGRLIVADVGQNKFEEVDIVVSGGNYGWNIREASYCYDPPQKCRTEGLIDPVYDYTHFEGKAITGGAVYTGSAIKGLKNLYVFGEFGSGFLRAIELPDDPAQKVTKVIDLGRINIGIVSFARDSKGELYLADFFNGTIYKLIPG